MKKRHCKYICRDCLMGEMEGANPLCHYCLIRIAYENGVNQGYHESEMWDRCPPQGSHIEYPNDGNYR